MATEEQTQYNAYWTLSSVAKIRSGQRLTISGRTVTKLGFWLSKLNNPTGTVTFTIRKVSDDSVIMSKVWGDASALPGSATYEEVTFDTPTLVNEEVRILCEFSGGDGSNGVKVWLQASDVKGSEYQTEYLSSWTEHTTWDNAYIYTYSTGWAGKISGVTNPAKIAGVSRSSIAKVKGVASA